MLDATDQAILDFLQENSRMSNAEIARRVGLAPSAIFQRIRKLEDSGVIRKYRVDLDPIQLGYCLVAFVNVRTAEGAEPEATARLLAEIDEVQEVHRVVGDDCFVLKVRVRDNQALVRLLDDKIRPLHPIASTRTTIVLTTAKEDSRLHIGDCPARRSDA